MPKLKMGGRSRLISHLIHVIRAQGMNSNPGEGGNNPKCRSCIVYAITSIIISINNSLINGLPSPCTKENLTEANSLTITTDKSLGPNLQCAAEMKSAFNFGPDD